VTEVNGGVDRKKPSKHQYKPVGGEGLTQLERDILALKIRFGRDHVFVLHAAGEDAPIKVANWLGAFEPNDLRTMKTTSPLLHLALDMAETDRQLRDLEHQTAALAPAVREARTLAKKHQKEEEEDEEDEEEDEEEEDEVDEERAYREEERAYRDYFMCNLHKVGKLDAKVDHVDAKVDHLTRAVEALKTALEEKVKKVKKQEEEEEDGFFQVQSAR